MLRQYSGYMPWYFNPSERHYILLWRAKFSGSGALTAVNPFAQADIVDIAGGGVKITIQLYSGLDTGAKVDDVYFNYGTTAADVTLLAGSGRSYSGTSPSSVLISSDAYNADGANGFDVHISYLTSAANAFVAGETSTITFTATGLSEALFNNLSGGGGGHGPFATAIHVLSLPPDGLKSGYWANCTNCGAPPQVPLPGAVWLMGTVLLSGAGLGALRRSRLQKAA